MGYRKKLENEIAECNSLIMELKTYGKHSRKLNILEAYLDGLNRSLDLYNEVKKKSTKKSNKVKRV